MSKKISYNEAFAEIEQIIDDIENDKYGIDELAEKVKRVTYLAGLCKEKLRLAEAEISSIMDGLKE